MAKEIKLKTRRLILSPMESGELEGRVNQREEAYDKKQNNLEAAPGL